MSAVATPPSSGRTGLLPPNADGSDRLSHLSFATQPVDCSAVPLEPSPATLPRVPGYQVLREVGRGGMGVVYQAHQLGVKRLVAIKMIGAGRLAHREEFIRFQMEAEMAARVRHPNVVQIHEVGQADGHPFLAMEWVEGGTLADALRRRRFSPAEAVELLITLAEAVQAAHSQGIIHRDLKPGNILLAVASTPGADSRPAAILTPKITDFGLAMERDRTHGLTGRGIAVGTAEYMAPEQARGTGLAVGPEADVYALGVMLYELLAHRLPLRGSCEVDTLILIQSQDPPPLREVVRTVPRDLAVICHKCLQKDPQQRYRTAQELAADLRRFRAGQPIHARPVPRVERAWLWVRRNAVVSALLLLLFLGAVGSVAGLTLLYLNAATQRAKYEEQRNEAWKLLDRATEAESQARAAEHKAKRAERDARDHADAADRLSDYLVNGLLRGIHPEVAKFRVVSLEEMLDLAAGKVDGAFAGQPLDAAQLHFAFGEAYLNLGKYAKAREAASRALELREKELGANDDRTLAARSLLARTLAELADHRGALEQYRAVQQEYLRRKGPDHAATLLVQSNLASCLHALGQKREALELIQDTLVRGAQHHGPEARLTVLARGQLGIFLTDAGRHADAVKLLEEVLRHNAEQDMESLRDLRLMNSLSRAYRHLRKFSEADQLDQKCVEVLRRVFGSKHPQMVYSLANLGQSAMRQRLYADAESYFKEAWDLAREVLGDQHEATGAAQYNLATALDRQGRHADAIQLLEENLSHFVRLQGEDSEGVQHALGGLAHAHADLGKFAEARAFYQRLLDLRLKKYGLTEVTCNTLPDYCYLLERMQEFEALDRLLAEYVAKAKALPEAEALNAAMIYNLAGRFALHRGKTSEAEKLLRDALAAREPRLSPEDRSVFSSQALLALSLLRQKKYAEAEPLLLKAYQAQSRAENVVPSRLEQLRDLLARTYEGLNAKEKAAQWRGGKPPGS